MCKRHRNHIVLAPSKKRQPCSPIQYGRQWVAVEFGFGQDGATDAEALLAIRDVEGGDGRVMGYLEKGVRLTIKFKC